MQGLEFYPQLTKEELSSDAGSVSYFQKRKVNLGMNQSRVPDDLYCILSTRSAVEGPSKDRLSDFPTALFKKRGHRFETRSFLFAAPSRAASSIRLLLQKTKGPQYLSDGRL